MEKEVRHRSIYLSCIDYISSHFTSLSNRCLSAQENREERANGQCWIYNSDAKDHRKSWRRGCLCIGLDGFERLTCGEGCDCRLMTSEGRGAQKWMRCNSKEIKREGNHQNSSLPHWFESTKNDSCLFSIIPQSLKDNITQWAHFVSSDFFLVENLNLWDKIKDN